MDLVTELDILIRSRCTLILLVSTEEDRSMAALLTACEARGLPLRSWDCADGFKTLTQETNDSEPPLTREPLTALDEIERDPNKGVYALLDFHECWTQPQVKRKLRTLARDLKSTNKTVVISSALSEVPVELRNEIVSLQVPLPTSEEHLAILSSLMKTPKLKVDLSESDTVRLADAALGLTAAQAQRVFSKAIVTDGKLCPNDIDAVSSEKREIIKECAALEYYEVSETDTDVGGLGALKEWLRIREKAFSPEARTYGLPPPRGLALIGIPGTGKSLSAKMISALWRLPLLRFDVGSVFQSLVGQSEESVRKALHLAETVSPCILWVDEMEKALAHGGNDSGVSTRVFGTILTWMAERRKPCFVVATANNISMLPPELLRRGRFDEIFFLDQPSHEERKEIVAVHLKRRNRDPKLFDLEKVALSSEGYVGAELEQAIIDAMYVGFDQGREFTSDDLLRAVKKQIPMSISQRENITHLRKWLQDGRAISASSEKAA